MKKSIGIGGGVGLAIACCAIIVGGQNQKQNEDAKGDLARLTKAPVVPQMLVDSDGTLHFGPRTVPPPTLESAEARQSYARQMFARAPTDGSELINPYLPSTSSCLSVRHESGNALLPSEEQKCTGVIWKRRSNRQ